MPRLLVKLIIIWPYLNKQIFNLLYKGGGTTDYAVKVFYDAIEKESFECYLRPGIK